MQLLGGHQNIKKPVRKEYLINQNQVETIVQKQQTYSLCLWNLINMVSTKQNRYMSLSLCYKLQTRISEGRKGRLIYVFGINNIKDGDQGSFRNM